MAAKSIAERVSKEFQTPLGKRVGFRVGQRDGVAIADSKRISDDTQIEYVTEGLLLAQLRGSPKRIKNYDIIIIDEAHERNIETDLLSSFLRNHLRRLKASCLFGLYDHSDIHELSFLVSNFYRTIQSPMTFLSKLLLCLLLSTGNVFVTTLMGALD